jgi:hypothetical protein
MLTTGTYYAEAWDISKAGVHWGYPKNLKKIKTVRLRIKRIDNGGLEGVG